MSYAASALAYLCFKDGVWTGSEGLCVGIVAFVEDTLGWQTPADSLAELKHLMGRRQTDLEAIVDWFDRTYGEA